jgi:hypothetical protein
MAELKTKLNDASVDDFLSTVAGEQVRNDCYELIRIMKQVSNEDPKMWGSSIIGFGIAHLKYASGRELDWMIIGFSPRKKNLTLYMTGNFHQENADLLAKLGKYKTDGGCIYIKTLQDVDTDVLRKLCEQTFIGNTEK